MDINGRRIYMVNEINKKTDIRIEDIYISNSMLNKIIISLCYSITIRDSSAEMSNYITNINKKKKRFLESIGLSNDNICITLNDKKYYQIETAAVIIAYFLFPPRTKDSFPMKVMNGEFQDITGNQLLAFLHKSSCISKILIEVPKVGDVDSDHTDDSYIEKVVDYINRLCSKYKDNDLDNYNEYSFTNQYYDGCSDKFNELVMYANIKAQQEELIDDVSELVNDFLKESVTERKDRSKADDIFDALRPIDIPEGTNEADVHTMICLYHDIVNDFSQKIIDATITMKRFVCEIDYGDLFDEKADVFKMIIKCFDELNDKGENVYESIKKSCGKEYLNGLYEYIKNSCFPPSFEDIDNDEG